MAKRKRSINRMSDESESSKNQSEDLLYNDLCEESESALKTPKTTEMTKPVKSIEMTTPVKSPRKTEMTKPVKSPRREPDKKPDSLPRTLAPPAEPACMRSQRPYATGSKYAEYLESAHKRQSPCDTLTVIEKEGDLFDAPPLTLLVHACNTYGVWGAGIADTFAKLYPAAEKIYKEVCKNAKRDISGRALLIAPQHGDYSQHFIGCLFTSAGFGRGKDSNRIILQNTQSAMKDLLHRVQNWNKNPCNQKELPIIGIDMCKINSGIFGVKWQHTRRVLEQVSVDDGEFEEVTVVTKG